MRKYSILVFFVCSLFLSCSEDDHCIPKEDTIIKYGTSFGFCVGYCQKTITLSKSNMVFEKSAWTDKASFPDKTCDFDSNIWQDLISKIDIVEFGSLPTSIGCPDCADGGAEWIEISTENDDPHRVTFEYNQAPDQFESFIEILRTQLKNEDLACQ